MAESVNTDIIAGGQGKKPLQRSHSQDLLPSDMSEVRVVLLGNNQSERNKIGNLLLGHTGFSEDGALSNCMRVSGVDKNSQMVVINTPDLLDPNISLEKLTEKVQSCVRCSKPGPHVFLLVLQPEDFTKEQRIRLQSILENISHRSFDHSLVLISTPRHHSTGHMINYVEYPSLDEIIRKCRYRHIQQKNLEHPELLTRLGQVVKENHEQHVHCDVNEDASGPTSTDDSKRPDASSLGPERAADSGLRIVLLGKSDNKKSTLGNSIIKNQGFSSLSRFNIIHSETKQVADGKWKGKSVRVVKTTDLFSQSVESVRKEIEEICASDCSPGPNVFLLLLKPSEFTEEDRRTLKFIMASFHQEDFNNFIVIKTDEGHEANKPFKRTIQDCGGRLHTMTEDKIPSLMEKMKNIVSEHKGRCLTSVKGSDKMTPKSNPPLNLVLCGTSGAGKTSAANAILGQTQNPSGSSSPTECVKRQAEVCGRWVTLVELPSLYETSEEMIYNALKCVSLCDPEGVHAFLLAVPVGPLTDEDKAELQSIQDVFTSVINDFTRVLLTVESDPTAQAFVNFVDQNKDIKELCKSYADHFVFNIKNSKQVPELLDAVEKMSPLEGRPLCFTKEMFIKAQMEKIIQQDKHMIQQDKRITKLLAEGKKFEKPSTRDDDSQSLRMVLIGKTGSGKSASGNTILNQEIFTSKLSQKSVTKFCRKVDSKVDGRRVVVLDTPGLFDTSLSQEEVQQEMIKCISLLAPGPHVFLLVLEIGRFTEEEKKTLKLLQDAFGEDSKKFTIILLTGGDKLERINQSTEDFLEGCDDSFRKLISDCGERYHVFNNVDGKNRKQVSDLLMKIDKMVKVSGGECYTTEMFQEAEAAIQKQMENILKEKEDEMKREVEELKRTHEEEKQAMKERMKEQEGEIEKERKKRATQLKEKEDSIKKEREEREKERVKREEEDNKRKGLEENKRNEWNEKLKALEREKQKASEEKDRELELKRKEMIQQGDAWEKERRAWLDKRHQEDEERREEEHNKIKKLQEEFGQERQKNEKKRTEDDQKRQEILQQMKKEQEKREMEDGKRKEEEENKLKARENELEALAKEKKIGSEEMQKQKENWKKEREIWEKKEQENKERREKEEKKINRLQEEFEHERKEHERRRKEEDKHRQEEEEAGKQRIVDEFRKKEQKEQQRRDEEDRKRKTQDEMKQKEWENKVEALERERKKAEENDRKLLDNQREELRKQKEAWDQERTGWWNKRQQEDKERREEQQNKIKKLQEEFDQEREKHEKTKEEEVKKIRQEKEKEREKLEKEHQEKLVLMENEYKDEARKQAEELNDFKKKYQKELEDLIQKQKAEIRELEQNKVKYVLLSHKEAELKKEVVEKSEELKQDKVRYIQKEAEMKKKALEDMKENHDKQKKDLEKKYYWRPGCINS